MYIFSADITPEMLKLCSIIKVKVFFLVLVYVFNSDLLDLEKGLFSVSYDVQNIFLVFCRMVLTYHPKDPNTVFSSRVVDRQRTPLCLLFWPNVAPRFPSVVF